MKTKLLISTIAIGLAAAGCNKTTRTETVATDTTTRTEAAAREAGNDLSRAANRAGDKIERAGERTAAAMSNMGHDIKAKYTEWKLDAKDLQADITGKRDIVRTRDVAGAPTGNIDKSTLQAAVKGRIMADPELANLKLDINADQKNAIQLEGKAQNSDQIARAIALALDTDGVYKVTSKIRIDDDAVKNR